MRISSGAVHNLPATKHRMQSIWMQLQLLTSTEDMVCTGTTLKTVYFLTQLKTSSFLQK